MSSRCSPSSVCEASSRCNGRSVDEPRGRVRSRSSPVVAVLDRGRRDVRRRDAWRRRARRGRGAGRDDHDRVDDHDDDRAAADHHDAARCRSPTPPPVEPVRRRADHADRHDLDPEDRARAPDLRRRLAHRRRSRSRALAGLGDAGPASATRCSPATASRTRTRSSTSICSRRATRSIFDMTDGTFTYAVTSITIVQPDQLCDHRPDAERRR